MKRCMPWLFFPLVLGACPEPQDHDPDEPSPPGEVDLEGSGGGVAVIHWPEDAYYPEESFLLGIFPTDLQGFRDPVECAFFGVCVVPPGPALGDWLPLEAGFDLEATSYHNVGDTVGLGTYTAGRQVAQGGIYYYQGEVVAYPGAGPVGLSLPDGAFGLYDGHDDVDLPDPVVLTEPSPTEPLVVVPGQVLPLSWEPAGGQVELALHAEESRLYMLEDSGSFELDLADLDIPGGEPFTLVLSRKHTSYLALDGHTVAVTGKSEQWLYGEVLAGDLLDLDDGCIDPPEIQEGAYYGWFDGHTDTIDLDGAAQGCSGAPTSGQDGFVRVTVPGHHRLELDYWVEGADQVLYLLASCDDGASCVAGPDQGWSQDGRSHLAYVNDDPEPQELLVALDAVDPFEEGALFTLEAALDPVQNPEALSPADSCGDTLPLVQPDRHYHGWIGEAHTDALDLGVLPVSCTGAETPGSDGWVQVEVGASQQLVVDYWAGAADGAIYLLETCDDPESCIEGADDDWTVGGAEQLTWVNHGEATMLTLVLDAWNDFESTPFSLEVQVQDAEALTAADTCADDVPLVGPGLYYGFIDEGYGNTVDLPSPNECTGFETEGRDGMVRVEVPAGHELTVDYQAAHADAAIYLLTSCGDPGSCVAGADENYSVGGAERLSWTNDGSTVELYLGLDAWAPFVESPFVLELGLEGPE